MYYSLYNQVVWLNPDDKKVVYITEIVLLKGNVLLKVVHLHFIYSFYEFSAPNYLTSFFYVP